MRLIATSFSLLLVLGGVLGCDGEMATPDAGPERPDTGPPMAMCPTTMTPAPEEQMLPCCYRFDQAGQQAAPEMRLTYLRLVAPEGSTLTSNTLATILNQAMQEETFNWLFRVDGADADGPVDIITGFGRRETSGTYAFSSGAAGGDPATWCPVTIPATLTGETVESEAIPGSITVPIFDEDNVTVQLELTLRQVQITESTWSENRNCVGERGLRAYTYEPAGTLTAFIEVEQARTGMISVPPVETTVCAAIAGPSLGDATYCDTTAQAEWQTKPDSLCDASGCTLNPAGTTDVCDPDSTCNAWQLVANYAAAGVDISNGACAP